MKLGRVSGVEIHLNNMFLALIGLFFVAGVLGKGLLAFGIVLVHELAHVYAARRLGISVSGVELLPFGGVSRMGSEVMYEPSREVMVAAAGPAANLLLAGAGLFLKSRGIWDEELVSFFLQCNLMVAAFNLLPAIPLDGGRVYRSYLAKRIGFQMATYRAARWGQFWGAAIILGGLFGLFRQISGLDVIVTGLFLFYAATREKSMARYHFIRHLALKKEELTAHGVLPGEPLAALESARLGEVIRVFLPQRFHLVLLFDRGLQYRGMVTEAQIVDALLTEGYDTPVGRLLKKE
ncbi:MAG: M50 family metallopeptidase [Peptococcaceae bacterium]|nr:M50 family metallopeptidase [Peptococcaceae bacterium]